MDTRQTKGIQGIIDPFIPEDLLARFFRALADPTRLRILSILAAGGERNVTELTGRVGATQSGVSNHLSCLRMCGLVSTRKEGKSVFYKISDPSVRELIARARGMVERSSEAAACCLRDGGEVC